jgi:RimJ/RimL family protein N-acetyltransferase
MTALLDRRTAETVAPPALPRQTAPALAPAETGLPRQPLIRTGRLTLRRPEKRDAAAIAQALANHRVARMLMRVPQPYHLEDAEEWLEGFDRTSSPKCWHFAITLGGIRAILSPSTEAANGNVSDRLIGVVSIEWREAGARSGWHLGYWLDEAHWNKGIMTDAVNAVVARFFSVMMGETLFSSVMADNPASLRIQGKLGFDITGVEDGYSESRATGVRLITTELTFGGYMPM